MGIWFTVFQGLVSRDWQYTEATYTPFIRVTRLSDPGYEFLSKVEIAKASLQEGNRVLYPKYQLWADPETKILEWDDDPFSEIQHSVAIRRNRRFKINYRIKIEVWLGEDENDFPPL